MKKNFISIALIASLFVSNIHTITIQRHTAAGIVSTIAGLALISKTLHSVHKKSASKKESASRMQYLQRFFQSFSRSDVAYIASGCALTIAGIFLSKYRLDKTISSQPSNPSLESNTNQSAQAASLYDDLSADQMHFWENTIKYFSPRTENEKKLDDLHRHMQNYDLAYNHYVKHGELHYANSTLENKKLFITKASNDELLKSVCNDKKQRITQIQNYLQQSSLHQFLVDGYQKIIDDTVREVQTIDSTYTLAVSKHNDDEHNA